MDFLKSKTKIIFWGTPEFAVPSLKKLIQHGYQIVAVVTRPDEPAGRGRVMTPPPVKVVAEKHHIPVFQPEKLDTKFLEELPEADLAIVVAYGKIIPADMVNSYPLGMLNVHPSLLPHWRGPAPIQYSILHGDSEFGVTLMKVDERMDHGPIVSNSKLKTQNSKLTYGELHDILSEHGAGLLIETLPNWLAGEIKSQPQDDAKATFSKLIRKDDARIDWSKPAREIARMVRAFNPRPGAWTLWPHDSKIFRIRIDHAEYSDEEPPHGSPGFVWQTPLYPLMIKTGTGSLRIISITIEGKKTLPAQDFIRGHPAILETTFV